MPLVDFARLPDTARLWVFPASRQLDESERTSLLATVDEFLEQWAAHGVPLAVGRDWRFDRFLLVAVDEQATGASGCSVDALVRCLRGVESDIDVRLTDYEPIVFRTGTSIRTASRTEFSSMAATGDVDLSTVVFDNSITSVGDLQQGRWELAAGESWHANLVAGGKEARR